MMKEIKEKKITKTHENRSCMKGRNRYRRYDRNGRWGNGRNGYYGYGRRSGCGHPHIYCNSWLSQSLYNQEKWSYEMKGDRSEGITQTDI